MAGVLRPGGDEVPRDRTLNDDKLAAPSGRMSIRRTWPTPTKLGLKFLLVTAQRRGEITSARGAHLDLEAAIRTLAAELLKNGKEHKVPLSPLAIQILT